MVGVVCFGSRRMDFTWQFWCSLTPEVNYRILLLQRLKKESVSSRVHCKPLDSQRRSCVTENIIADALSLTSMHSFKWTACKRDLGCVCSRACLCSGKQRVMVNITVDFVSHILCLSGCSFRLFSTFLSLLIFLFLCSLVDTIFLVFSGLV